MSNKGKGARRSKFLAYKTGIIPRQVEVDWSIESVPDTDIPSESLPRSQRRLLAKLTRQPKAKTPGTTSRS